MSLLLTGCVGPWEPFEPREGADPAPAAEEPGVESGELIVSGLYTETVTATNCEGAAVGEQYSSLGVMVRSGDELTLDFDTFPTLAGHATLPAEVRGYAEWPLSPSGGLMRCTVGGIVSATDSALTGRLTETLEADEGGVCRTTVEFEFLPEERPLAAGM